MGLMNRRDLLIGAGAFTGTYALFGTLSNVLNAAPAAPPAKDPHAGHSMHGAANPLSEAAAACIKNGEACLQHCLAMYAAGDTSMGACGKTVSDMLAATRGLLSLSLGQSKHVKAFAKVAADIAKDCEAECKKHDHAVCKACAECCAKLIAEVGKL